MKMNELVELLLEIATLKRMPRTGWQMRGVPHVESVADHSYGVVFVTLALVDALQDEELDLEKVLVMALLHDLAEVRVTDLPVSATHLIPARVKRQAELSAITALLAPLPSGERWKALWQELDDRTSPEGCLVRDADKLEMIIQCLRYEQAGSQGLDEYWQSMDRRKWHYAFSAELYARLKEMRPGSG
jgi:putative hydrolase of HD superfamily